MHINRSQCVYCIDAQHVYGAWLTAALHRVNDDEAIIRSHQRLRERDASGPNLQQLDAVRLVLVYLQPAYDLDAEPIVPSQHVAESGDQRSRG